MPYSVRCKACSASFAIPDEIWDKRVRGRMATLKCRSCKAEIHVDGTKEGVVQLSVAPPPEPASAPEPAPAPAPAPVVAPATAASPLPPVAVPVAPTISTVGVGSATATASGVADVPAKVVAASPTPPHVAVPAASLKPIAKAAQDVAAADVGWSLMPPPGDLELVGLSPTPSPMAGAPKFTEPSPVAPSPSLATSESVPPLSVPPEAIVDEPPPDPHLWVVSYGDNDDRELTEKQIATELIKGHITLSTIVWQEGMDEWLPISGVKVLAKYAPTLKPAPIRQAKPALAGKAGTQPARATPAPTLAAGKSSSTVTRQAAQPRAKQPSSPIVAAKGSAKTGDPEHKPTAGFVPKAEVTAQPQLPAGENKSAKGPPPLDRAASKSGDPNQPAGGSRVPVNKSAAFATSGGAGGKPPPLGRRPTSSAEAPSPWTEDEPVEEVLTSAPQVSAALQPHAANPSPAAAAAFPGRKAAPPAATSAPAGSTPSQRAGAKTSFRPPKPVETATSTVMRTEASPNKDLLITDEDFLAMQRRFPKWALPAAIAGGVALVGLIVLAANSSDEPVPLPVAPTADPNAAPRENPANQAQPRHPQPNLDTMPTLAGVTSDEKDFAKLFAQSATKTNSTFDLRAAEKAALNVMELAARCRVAPDPAGQARVLVTFSTAGQVLSVQLGSPYANTATGKCVEKALRQIKTRAFQGEPGRLPLTVPIH